MSTFFESVPNGTLGFQIQKSGFGLNLSNPSIEWVHWIRNPFLDLLTKEQKIHFWIRNPDLDLDQRNAP